MADPTMITCGFSGRICDNDGSLTPPAIARDVKGSASRKSASCAIGRTERRLLIVRGVQAEQIAVQGHQLHGA